MARLISLLFNLPARGKSKRGLHNGRLRKALAVMSLIFMLVVCTAAPAQTRHGSAEPLPPRPEKSYKPWPWFIAFILLGLACYPAFKNSKRELNE